MTLLKHIDTFWRLGFINLLRVLIYKLKIKYWKLFPPTKPKLSTSDLFFQEASDIEQAKADKSWLSGRMYFGWYQVENHSTPNWFQNVFNQQVMTHNNTPWWSISDFDNNVGDIKTVWELSRFEWVVKFAQLVKTGNSEALDKINKWLKDWLCKNPPYLGPNWKCGQEASIRVMHLAAASLIINNSKTEPALIELIQLHLKRISVTIGYALAQNNNHGTSEAAALFIGGSWLERYGIKEGRYYSTLGRKWLEERANKLIDADGGFSQYSTNYHRLMLDTFCLTEVWRKHLNLHAFSSSLYFKLAKASEWLYEMTQLSTGLTPNLGANDGAKLLPLTSCDYRDYRPSLQLSMALFNDSRAIVKSGAWDEVFDWLNITKPTTPAPKQRSTLFENGGYAVLRLGSAFVLLRYPKFHFRPSHCDALHVDFWIDGENLLKDAGSYSYNSSEDLHLENTEHHNTIQFDNTQQMPRISRFLFGNWLESKKSSALLIESDTASFSASYKNNKQHYHLRQVQLSEGGLRVIDNVSGFKDEAILRWRLSNSNWKLHKNTLSDGKHLIKVSANTSIKKMSLTTGWESLYYLKKNKTPVLEVTVSSACTIKTEYIFKL
ncbi:heparinase II/III family protein [Flocculibacter collagenilyticus]|uniref:heparinase II/III family protein n=1 Tax=Flocculibacter collagenilyticus TaxID=2744479 RepID=UPI0018F2D5B4|nr:heparinase II/III-family protein [Flocculibacter collagenilyticus]